MLGRNYATANKEDQAVTVEATNLHAPRVELVLTGEKTPVLTLLADAWRAKALLIVLSRHDFHSRYRSATLGVLWSVLLPLLQGVVFAVVFTRVVRVPISGGVDYAAFVITGTMAWSFLTSSVTIGSTAIVDAGDVAAKVYFPRLLLPAVPVLSNAPSLVISLAVALGVTLATGTGPTGWLLLAPVAVLALLALAGVLCAVTSLLYVYFRDVRYIVTAVTLLALYVAPVIYPLSRAGRLRVLLEVNPATGPLQLVRQALLGHATGGLQTPMASFAIWIIVLSVATVVGFARHERLVMDRL